MAYLAGMIWSVSMLAPNFQALPRMTFGKVMGTLPLPGGGIRGGGRSAWVSSPPAGRSARSAGWGRSTRHLRRQMLQHLARVRDHPRDRAGRGHGRVGEIDHRLGVAHAAGEVAVGRAQA